MTAFERVIQVVAVGIWTFNVTMAAFKADEWMMLFSAMFLAVCFLAIAVEKYL